EYMSITESAVIASRTNALTLGLTWGSGRVRNTIIAAATKGSSSAAICAGGGASYPNAATISVSYCGIFNYVYALYTRLGSCEISANSTHIDSSCTYGAYGYNITLVSC